ncbi:MAG: hypothetical protein DCC68_23565 [Planctomycetota bacterium]|nr:MAG: hypothetical protein DCC68_23565 [Planctomycetota bacterium]
MGGRPRRVAWQGECLHLVACQDSAACRRRVARRYLAVRPYWGEHRYSVAPPCSVASLVVLPTRAARRWDAN